MNMRSLLIAIIFLFSPVSGARAETRIAFINPGLEDEFFWPAVTDTMRAAAAQFGFSLEVTYAERDAQTMIRQGLEIANRADPPDIMILVNEFQAAREILNAADARGIKVLMLLSGFLGNQLRDVGSPGEKYRNWIGSLVPSYQGAGQRMAKSLYECMAELPTTASDGRHHVLVLSGDGRTPASLERTAGMHLVFADTGHVVVDRHFNTNWQSSDGARLTANYFAWAKSRGIQPTGIWAANDAIALGAIDAVRAAGLIPGKDICIVGLNWSPEAVELVERGEMTMTDGGHFLGGAWAMVMISDYLDRASSARKPIGNASFEMAPIRAQNVYAFQRLLKERNWRDIPFAAFKRSGGAYDFSLDYILTLMGARP